MQLAGRLKQFIEIWKIMTNDTEILSLAEGYIIYKNIEAEIPSKIRTT